MNTKALSFVFWFAVAGVGISFGMSLYIAFTQEPATNSIKADTTAVPALPE